MVKKQVTTMTTKIPSPKQEAEEQITSSSASSLSAPAVQTRKYPGTVTVAYNHPRSLTFLVTDNRGNPRRLTINGNATHLRGLPKGILPTGGQYGLTFGVDGELWEAVERKYGQMPAFENGLIVVTAESDIAAAVRERKDVRNGFEPIDPMRTNTKPTTTKDGE
jgi:hypothetical protein